MDKAMMTEEEAIAWIRGTWIAKGEIDRRQTLSHDGWEICVPGEAGGEMWLHAYPDGTMFLRAILPGSKGFSHLTNTGEGFSSREPWDEKAIAKSMDAICHRRASKEDPRYEQLRLI